MDKDKTEVVKVYCDFQKTAIIETASALSKGITYYFLIMAVLTGILLTQEGLAEELRSIVLIITILVSLLLAIAGLSIGYILYKGVKTLGNSLQRLDEVLFSELQMDEFITRGLRYSLVVLACSCLVLLAIVIGMCLIARH